MSFMQKLFGNSMPAAAHSPALNPQNGQPLDMNNPNPQGGHTGVQPLPPNNTVDPTLTPQQLEEQNRQKQSPGDEFKDLWNIDPKTNPQPANLAEFNFNMDPAKLQASVGQLDFTKVVTPEILTKIAAGGQDAVSAMMTAMNAIGQEAVKTAIVANSRITEAGIRTTGQRLQENLPTLVRNESVSSALREDNPLFTDPSTAPMMEVVIAQMAQKFPQATPQEIREQAKRYMVNFASNAAKFTGKQIVDQPDNKQQQGRQVQVDWSQEPIA